MSEPSKISKILIVQPSWVGDAVMATPMLRAMRELYPQAHIAYLMRRYVKPLYAGMPWADQLITYRTGRTKARAGRGLLDLAGRLRSARFDLAVLLPNSFKSALVCKLAKIEQVVGYDRDGRSFLLTDKLLPVKQAGKFIPTPLVRYYMGLARYLGSSARDLSLQLFITDPERRAAAQVLNRAGIDPSIHRPGAAGRGPLVLFNPGAAHGEAKCWLPEYFAELADRMMEELGATILLAGAPRERPIIQAVRRKIKGSVADLIDADLDLGSLKEITRRCDLVVTNDTGARHVAAAMQTPVVTIFGPTDPQWTEINFAHERKVSVKVFCGPCQKKYCPLDHRCMTRVTPAMVFNASRDLLRQQSSVPAT
ncbi:MAG: lipopolysaccharide heptosyltransferase II [Phycisphaerales bacterium]|nr:lipopolysaccharide heptosyltransferase II [Phycisphaerales bacterium]